MPVYDFSSGLNLLNQGINSFSEALGNRTDAQTMASIGQSVQQNDYNGASAKAWAAGKPDLALKLQQMGMGFAQTQAFNQPGGGTAPTALPPTAPSTSDPNAPARAPAPGQPITGGGGYTGGGFMGSVANIESGNRNIFSGVDKDYPGQPGSRSQGYFQIDTPTWQQFAPKAGVNTAQYPSAMNAPPDVQAQVAATIPLARFGPRTQTLLANQYGPLDKSLTLGQLARQHGAPQPGISATTAPATPGPSASAVTTAPLAPLQGSQVAAAPPIAPSPVNVAQAGPTQTPAGPQPTALPPSGADSLVTPALAAEPQAPITGAPPAGTAVGPQMSLPMLIQALQSGQVSYQTLAQNYQRFGLPAPNQPGAERIWFLLQRAGMTATPGRGPGVSAAADAAARQLPGFTGIPGAYGQPPAPTPPPGPQPAPAPAPPQGYGANLMQPNAIRQLPPPTGPGVFAGATAGAGAVPPAGAPPRQDMTTAAGLGLPPLIGGGPAAPPGPLPDWVTQGVQRLKHPPGLFGGGPTQVEPGYPTDYQPPAPSSVSPPPPPSQTVKTDGQPPADHQPATPPPHLQPKSARNAPVEAPPPTPPSRPPSMGNLPRGVVGYTPDGRPVYAGDPEANLPRALKGTTVGNLLERAGMAGPAPPAWAGTAQNILPADAARYPATAPGGPGAGAMPAALPPGQQAAAQRPGLGGMLAGAGTGLLNILSGQPAGGVPGLPTPASFLQGGAGGQLPRPAWMPQPGFAPPGLPMLTPGALGLGGPGPAAAAPAAGAPAPTGIEADIAQHQALADYYQRQAMGFGMINPEMAKAALQRAQDEQKLVSDLVTKRAESGIKTGVMGTGPGGETVATTRGDLVKEGMKNLQTSYNNVMSPGGPMNIIRNVNRMEDDLPSAISGWGPLQPEMEKAGALLARSGLIAEGRSASTEEFNSLAAQETAMLARALISPNRLGQREFQYIKENNINLANRQDAVRAILEYSRERAQQQIDVHNESVGRFDKTYPEQGGIAGKQFIVTPEEQAKYERTPPKAGGPGGAGTAKLTGAVKEGTIIKNNQTGARQIWRNGQWQPIQ